MVKHQEENVDKNKEMEIGDKVIKNTETWKKTAFDSWGRGLGEGEVVEPPFDLGEDWVDVRWPEGRCFEPINQLIKI